MNDIDGDIYNLFNVVRNRKDELLDAMIITPIHTNLWDDWRKNEETDELWKAVRFLYLSNLGFMGGNGSLHMTSRQHWEATISQLNETFDKIRSVQFFNCDFRDVVSNTRIIDSTPFIYADPPYINTGSNYTHDDWSKQDSIDLFDVLCGSGSNFAMSEFDSDFIVSQAKERNLNITNIGSRHNLGKRQNEILITNYQMQPTLF